MNITHISIHKCLSSCQVSARNRGTSLNKTESLLPSIVQKLLIKYRWLLFSVMKNSLLFSVLSSSLIECILLQETHKDV